MTDFFSNKDRLSLTLKDVPQTSVKSVLTDFLSQVTEHSQKRLETGPFGLEIAHFRSDHIDLLLQELWQFFCPKAVLQASCLIATGGYGRGLMAPYSDIDLLILVKPSIHKPSLENVLQKFLSCLWDAKFKIGHACRTIDEALTLSKDDLTIQTSLIDARYLTGNKDFFDQFTHELKASLPPLKAHHFIQQKFSERLKRHQKHGKSRYILEPNIKEGKGGLRDLQLLYLIGKSLHQNGTARSMAKAGLLTKEEAKDFYQAHNFLWTIRHHLHFLTNRGEERLSFDLQPEIARQLGYMSEERTPEQAVETFMKDYFSTAKIIGDLSRILSAALALSVAPSGNASGIKRKISKEQLGQFTILDGFLALPSSSDFHVTSQDILKLCALAQQTHIPIHPKSLQICARSISTLSTEDLNCVFCNKLFIEILTNKENPEPTLRILNEIGFLGWFIPEFAQIIAQMQFDMYHNYTVDEHSLVAMNEIHQLEQGHWADELPIASAEIHKINSRSALYVALFLHDIAKGRAGDHSILGAELAKDICPRLGLSEEETDTVSWLIQHHLALTKTAFRRDLEDPSTINEMVELCLSAERLRLLYLLTICDIRAVGPGRLTSFKKELLNQLFLKVQRYLDGGIESKGQKEQAQFYAQNLLQEVPEAKDLITLLPDRYLIAVARQEQKQHLTLIAKMMVKNAPLCLCHPIYHQESRSWELTLLAKDQKGLFALFAGAFTLASSPILNARIYTLKNGIALDQFIIHDTSQDPYKIQKIDQILHQALAKTINLKQQITDRKKYFHPGKTQSFTVPPRVLIYNEASSSHTIIEVNGKDRTGLLYELAQKISDLGLQIGSARVSTIGAKVIDVFYVRDSAGMKIYNKQALSHIREELINILNE